MSRILEGLRVVEVGSGLPTALAGMILSDFGADVVFVEPPGGSPLRELPAFRMWARGKRSAVADLASDAGRARLESFASGSDVVLSSLRPASAERAGSDPDALLARHPRLVAASVSGFGPSGPLRDVPGWEGVVLAKTGRLQEFQMLAGGGRPAFVAVPVVSYCASQLLLHGVLTALLERARTGRGRAVRTSLLQACSVYDIVNWLPGNPMRERIEDAPWLPYTAACTKDGVWIQFAQLSPTQYRAFIHQLDLDEIWEDERFRTAPYLRDPADARALRDRLLERVRARSFEEWQARFETDRDMAVERLRLPEEALSHPQLLHNGDVVDVEDPGLGASRQLGPLASFAATPARIRARAPTLDDAGEPPPARRDPPPGAPADGRPLAGVVILELATWIATPLAATLLADLGARVIKVEPLAGDPIRGVAGAHLKTVQGKESLAVDLKRPEGRALVQRLAERADVLLHNYRPDVPARLGIDAETLRARNPRLVHVHGSSYGSTGPCAAKPAYHPTFGALNGAALSVAGPRVQQPTPGDLDAETLGRLSRHLELANESHPDPSAGAATATAILLALLARERTGEGQSVETRMICSNAYALCEDYVDFAGRPPHPRVDAALTGFGPLYRLYETAEGWVFLAAPRPRDLARLCEALALDEVPRDPEALARALEEAFAKRTAGEVEDLLTRAGVACAACGRGPTARFFQKEGWVAEAGFWSAVAPEAPSAIGPYARYGPTVTLGGDVVRLAGPSATGGQTQALLEELGYDAEAREALRAQGVVAWPESPA